MGCGSWAPPLVQLPGGIVPMVIVAFTEGKGGGGEVATYIIILQVLFCFIYYSVAPH